MGLRPLDLAHWLEFDEHRDEEFALKARCSRRYYDAVVATNPEGDEASLELLEEVSVNLARYQPDS